MALYMSKNESRKNTKNNMVQELEKHIKYDARLNITLLGQWLKNKTMTS